jgi:hypothetical protein
MEYEAQARKAAKWWADHLRHGAKHDNGVGMDSMLLMYVSRSHRQHNPLSPDEAQRFEDALTAVFCEHLCNRSLLMVGTDYGPDGILYSAIERANLVQQIGQYGLPVKSLMSIPRVGPVVAKKGYGQPMNPI